MLNTAVLLIAQIDPSIARLDWGIVAVFLILGTILAICTRGRQQGIRDFFLGDRNLPWLLVCASLIATEISAASFVGVPYLGYSGSLIYLQLAIGAILARFVVGYLVLPAYYEQSVASPYHFIGIKLGLGSERMTRGLFVVGTVLGQSVRVFVAAMAIQIITGVQIQWTVLTITGFAALWVLLGGIRTVVWTNLFALGVIVIAGIAAVVYVVMQTTGGWSEIQLQAENARKFTFFEFDLDLVLTFTLWTGLFGSTFNTLASHGADHMNAQCLFCCRSAHEARKAVLWSALSQIFVILLIVVGLGLFAYYQQHSEDQELYSFIHGPRNIFAIFIGTVMPAGLKGVLVIGLLAAAISSLNSALSALTHVTSRALYSRVEPVTVGSDKGLVTHARLLTIIWAVVLGLMTLYIYRTFVVDADVDTALRITSFTYGALLGSLLLALFLKKRDGRGLLFAVPIAVLAAFGMGLRDAAWAHWVIISGVSLVLVSWLYALSHEVEKLITIDDEHRYVRRAWYLLLAEFPRTVWVLAGVALVIFVHFYGVNVSDSIDDAPPIAWPWYLPMATGITVALGGLLSRPRAESAPA